MQLTKSSSPESTNSCISTRKAKIWRWSSGNGSRKRRSCNNARIETSKTLSALWGGAFSDYIDIKDNVSKTQVDFLIGFQLTAKESSSVFFDKKQEVFDSDITYDVGFFKGLQFKETRMDGSEARVLVIGREVDAIVDSFKN